MLNQVKSKILAAITQLHNIRNAMVVWNQTRSVEKTKKAMISV